MMVCQTSLLVGYVSSFWRVVLSRISSRNTGSTTTIHLPPFPMNEAIFWRITSQGWTVQLGRLTGHSAFKVPSPRKGLHQNGPKHIRFTRTLEYMYKYFYIYTYIYRCVFVYTYIIYRKKIILAYFSYWLVESVVLVLQPPFACFLWGESDALLLDLDIRELLRRCHAEKKWRFHRQNGGAWGEGWWLKISWIIDPSLKYMVSSDGIKPLDTFKCLDWLLRILRKDTCHFTCIGLTLYGGQACSNGLPYRTDVFFTTFVHRPAMVFSLRSALISSLAGFASGDCFVRLSEPLKERVDIMISFFSHSKVSHVIRVWICINKIRDINRKGIKKSTLEYCIYHTWQWFESRWSISWLLSLNNGTNG